MSGLNAILSSLEKFFSTYQTTHPLAFLRCSRKKKLKCEVRYSWVLSAMSSHFLEELWSVPSGNLTPSPYSKVRRHFEALSWTFKHGDAYTSTQLPYRSGKMH